MALVPDALVAQATVAAPAFIPIGLIIARHCPDLRTSHA
jgi:hypothetical protein